ncbi:hypothetical protein AB0F72_09165 [Actinoplanes sp. NPDC023936]|uniref:hypothetical protein n=1 Tax=Actinoplanes sp. NPDC023936 TaxID=3154910 RepID=UPI0033E82F46
MTPERAKKLAGRWFIAALIALAIRVGLDLLGLGDEFTQLLYTGASILFLMVSMRRLGWSDGYRARDAEVARNEPT